jgi:DNA-binding NtrC family response regulator
MTASTILFVDDDRGSCTSLPDVIWDLDYQGSRAYGGPAARELPRRYISGLALLDYRSPGTDGVKLDGPLKPVQPGPAGVRVTGFAAEATVRAATQANIRQVMPMPVDLGRPIPPIEGAAGRP